MIVIKPLAPVLLMVPSMAFAQQTQRMPYLIGEATIANLLRASGANVAASQIHLPTQLRAASPDPHLRIVTTRKITDHELALEVHCGTTGECLPFDALIDVNDADMFAARMKSRSSDASARASVAGEVAENPSLHTEPAALPSDDLRAGSQAILVILDGSMCIHLPVIAMDSGSKGAQIRVRSIDRKKIFHARVVDGETVQGVIE